MRDTQREKVEAYEMTPNVERIIEAILAIVYEAGNRGLRVTQYDVVKSLFLADRAHLNKYGRPITYDNYRALLHGPVPMLAYDFLRENSYAMRANGIYFFPWTRKEAFDICESCYSYEGADRAPDEDVLSPSDLTELYAALTIIKSLRFGQIRKLTHEDQAYIDAWEDNSEQRSFPMSYTLLFDEPNVAAAKEVCFLSQHL
jgi:hypothetical protein